MMTILRKAEVRSSSNAVKKLLTVGTENQTMGCAIRVTRRPSGKFGMVRRIWSLYDEILSGLTLSLLTEECVVA